MYFTIVDAQHCDSTSFQHQVSAKTKLKLNDLYSAKGEEQKKIREKYNAHSTHTQAKLAKSTSTGFVFFSFFRFFASYTHMSVGNIHTKANTKNE